MTERTVKVNIFFSFGKFTLLFAPFVDIKSTESSNAKWKKKTKFTVPN